MDMNNMPKYAVEFIGTFLFFSVILGVGQPIPVVIALLAAIYFGGSVSGGHFNPGITFMRVMDETLSTNDAVLYVGAQLLAAYCAYLFYINVVRPAKSA
jgi:glycerol uptake facilitator-like aquaporin